MEHNTNTQPTRHEIIPLVETMIQFWYTTSGEIRCPFPEAIQLPLRKVSTQRALAWYDKLSPEEHQKLNVENVVEHLEALIFEEAFKLVSHDDDKVSIQYPLMPRVGDQIKHKDNPLSKVVKREVVCIREVMYLQVDFLTLQTHKKWQAKFELHP